MASTDAAPTEPAVALQAAPTVALVGLMGARVEIPRAVAWKHIGYLQREAEVLAGEGGTAAAEAGGDGTDSIEVDFSQATLDQIHAYLMNIDDATMTIPEPVTSHLGSFVKSWEMEFLRKIEETKLGVPVVNAAYFLQIQPLKNLIAAFFAQRIDEIARAAPSIMEGAEQLRAYLNIPNEWTEEEMRHLTAEMEYIKQIDPTAY